MSEFKNYNGRSKSAKGSEGFVRRASQSDLNDARPKGGFSARADHKDFPGLRSTYSQANFHVEGTPKKHAKLRLGLRVFKRLAFASTVLVLMIGIWLGVKSFLTARDVFDGGGGGSLALNRSVDPSQLNQEGDGRINILLLGKGGEGHDGGELTDSIIVASIDPLDNSAGLLSIPRDLYVDVPGLWSMKINAAFVTARDKNISQGASFDRAVDAGLDTLEDVVEQTIGIPIHYNVMVDFVAFEESVDALGGIEVFLEERVFDDAFLPELLLDVGPGAETLDGEEALALARTRKTSVRGDFDRSLRQRLILLAIKDKVLSAGTFANPVRLSQLLDVIGDNVVTNISLDEANQLLQIAQSISSDSIQSLSFVDGVQLVQSTFIGDQSVVIPVAGVRDFSEIQTYVRNQLVDSFIKDEAATITVLNGAGITGLATRRASELESYGYNVVNVDDASTFDYLNTEIIRTGEIDKPFTSSFLETRLNATTETSTDPALRVFGTDFVIIVGANESNN